MPIRLVLADITTLQVDAIVNAANSELEPGGGVDGAIHRASGPGLYAELRAQHDYLTPGEAIVTGGYRLAAKHVIHTVAPRWIDGLNNQVETLSDCYRNSLRLADRLDLKSIAFPALGTGAFGIPKEVAMPTALQSISLHLQNSHSGIEVLICCYTEEDLELYKDVAYGLDAVVGEDGEIVVNALLPKCPVCFHQLKRVVYGMPTRDTFENQENIYIGGCIVFGDDPDLGCKNCDWRGFIGDVNLIKGEWLALVVDLKCQEFVAGVSYHAGDPESALALKPGIADFQRGFTAEWLEDRVSSCKDPSYWLGKRSEIMSGALEEMLLRNPALTEEVMEFARFKRIDSKPALSAG